MRKEALTSLIMKKALRMVLTSGFQSPSLKPSLFKSAAMEQRYTIATGVYLVLGHSAVLLVMEAYKLVNEKYKSGNPLAPRAVDLKLKLCLVILNVVKLLLIVNGVFGVDMANVLQSVLVLEHHV